MAVARMTGRMSGGGEGRGSFCLMQICVCNLCIDRETLYCLHHIRKAGGVIKRLLGNAFCRSGWVLDFDGRVGKGDRFVLSPYQRRSWQKTKGT